MANIKKHIKKKYLVEVKATEEQVQQLHNNPDTISVEELSKLKRIDKAKQPLILFDSNYVTIGFTYRHQGIERIIPLPDPVLMYFHNAYVDYKEVSNLKKALIKKVTDPKPEDVINELYGFFGHATGVIINLFTTLEAFINRAIPSAGFDYVKNYQNKRTEIYNKAQIERYIPFEEKMNDVLAQVYKDKKKPFREAHPVIYSHLESLKDFRDALIHLKTAFDDASNLAYEVIFKKLMDYKYEVALNAVKDFCNYYHFNPSYIEECPCNQDD